MRSILDAISLDPSRRTENRFIPTHTLYQLTFSACTLPKCHSICLLKKHKSDVDLIPRQARQRLRPLEEMLVQLKSLERIKY